MSSSGMLGESLSNLPPLTHESRRLIAVYLDVDQNIEDLAAELRKDFFDTVAQLSQPAVRAWINAINQLKNNERRERALRSLDAVLTTAHDPHTIRRAATRILRHLELFSPPARPKGAPINTSTHESRFQHPTSEVTNAEPRMPNADPPTNHNDRLTNAQCLMPNASSPKTPPPEAFAPGGVSLFPLLTIARFGATRSGFT